MFTKKEKELLRLLIEAEFYSTLEYSKDYITIAKKLGLNESFIKGLEKDFESENGGEE